MAKDLFIEVLWYCPKLNKVFTIEKDLVGYSCYFPKGITNRKMKYPKETGCIKIGVV